MPSWKNISIHRFWVENDSTSSYSFWSSLRFYDNLAFIDHSLLPFCFDWKNVQSSSFNSIEIQGKLFNTFQHYMIIR